MHFEYHPLFCERAQLNFYRILSPNSSNSSFVIFIAKKQKYRFELRMA